MIDAVYWILFLILVGICIYLSIKLLLTPASYFNSMDPSHVISIPLSIPVGDIDLNAALFLPKYAMKDEKLPLNPLPLVIFHPGWGLTLNSSLLRQVVTPIVLAGPYACLSYDFRGSGKTPGEKKMLPIILEDIPKVINFAEKLPEVDPTRIAFMGVSFGSVAALTHAYNDERIKAVISLVGLNEIFENFNRKPKNIRERIALKFLHMNGVQTELLSEADNQFMSPKFRMNPDRPDLNARVFIENAMDDPIIMFDSFKKNQEILNLPPSQYLILERGGHSGAHQELIILSRIVQFLKSKLDLSIT